MTVWLTLVLWVAPLAAQEGSLTQVESLMAGGRVQEAREILLVWWEHRAPTASRGDLQWGIWLRAKLTVDPSLAEVDFRRLAVEYPGGEYSDDALHRLGLLAHARGDMPEARSHFLALARDYPNSPLRARAQEWLSRLGVEASSPGGEGRDPTSVDTAQARPGEVPPMAGEPGPTLAVQIGAFRDPAGARTLAAEVEALGYSARVVRVPGSDLVKVRIGRFSRRESADSLARELRGKGVECTLATDAHREVEVGSRQRDARALPMRARTSSARWPMSSRPDTPS